MANTTGLGDTIYAAVKKAINDAEGGGGSGSGGGGGDFTTAHVTLEPVSGKTSTADMAYLKVCTTAGFEGITFASPSLMSTNLYFDAILYKGASLLSVEDGANFSIVSTSGAIEQMDQWSYMITGDCTITVEDI